jgi:phosphate-selective porin OprO/OprP
MTTKHKWIVAAIIGTQFVTAAARADDTADAIAALKKQIETLNAKVEQLEKEHQEEIQHQAQIQGQPQVQSVSQAADTQPPPKALPFFTAGADGFSIQSADTNFTLHLDAVGQLDWHYYGSPDLGAKDTLTIRRLRLITSGTLYKDYDYYIQTDFGAGNSVTSTNNSILQDAYLNIHYWPGFQIQAGKFKELVNLEWQPTDANLWFVERSYPSELVPNRNVGAEIHGNFFGSALSYAAGAFNELQDGGSGDIETGGNSPNVAARIFAVPFTNTTLVPLQNFGLGLGSSYGNESGLSLPSFTTMGRQSFFSYATGSGTKASPNVTDDGEHFRLVPQGYYFWGPAGFYWEYADSSQKFLLNNGKAHAAWLDNKGWDVSASWYLTGEKDNFATSPAPLHPFHIDGSGLGAWQLTARIGGLSLDPAAFNKSADFAKSGSAQEATTWGVGLDWYMNRNIKWIFDYEQTSFGFAPGATFTKDTVQAQDERVLMGRLQFAF